MSFMRRFAIRPRPFYCAIAVIAPIRTLNRANYKIIAPYNEGRAVIVGLFCLYDAIPTASGMPSRLLAHQSQHPSRTMRLSGKIKVNERSLIPLLNFSLRSLNANSLRQPLFFKLKAHVVVSGVREVSQSVGHSHDEENSRIVAHGHARIALFDVPHVVRLIDARCAAKLAGIRRRRRASRMSCPSLRSARRTGIGNIVGFFSFHGQRP
jgi:hypothetical protein